MRAFTDLISLVPEITSDNFRMTMERYAGETMGGSSTLHTNTTNNGSLVNL